MLFTHPRTPEILFILQDSGQTASFTFKALLAPQALLSTQAPLGSMERWPLLLGILSTQEHSCPLASWH